VDRSSCWCPVLSHELDLNKLRINLRSRVPAMSELPPPSGTTSLCATLGDPSSLVASDLDEHQDDTLVSRSSESRSLSWDYEKPRDGQPEFSPKADSGSTSMSDFSCRSDLNEADGFLATDPKDMEEVDMWSKHNIGLYAAYAAVGLSLSALSDPVSAACRSEDYFTAENFKVRTNERAHIPI
jgi:hypothetical protein